ncbi:MAG: hypothetical protein IKZ06_03305 [Oscillospiraceae bacterium]|nr:hypothetical protein [Oscillospiraceae bacterium]
MPEFFQRNKKLCVISGIVAAVIIFAIYLYALFLPGFWYGDVFLYREKAPFEGMEVYSGHDAVNKADYQLTMSKEGMVTYMVFTVNEEERFYEITSDNSKDYYPDVTIFENGEQVFKGTYMGSHLVTEEGEFFKIGNTVTVDGFGSWDVPTKNLFPSYNWLYEVSQSVKTEIRGEAYWLICIVLLIGLVTLDMVHPDFFWCFNNWLDVKGGEPSEFYRFCQKAFWIASPFIVLILMAISFMPKSMFL